MLSIMLCLITIKAIHYHTEEKRDSWEKTFGISYEPVCHICMFTASLIYDFVQENVSSLLFTAEAFFIIVILSGHSVPVLTFYLRAPPTPMR